MSYQVQSGEPLKFSAGDRVRWLKSLPDYPPDEWTLRYYLKIQNDPNDNSGPITFAATADGGSHAVDVASTTTANWVAGSYFWTAYVELTATPTERYKVGHGFFTVEANIATVTAPFDARTQARKILDALLTAYENRASRPEKAYSISAAGRSFTYKTDEELIMAIQFWQGEVKREEQAANLGKGRNIFVRFGTPT